MILYNIEFGGLFFYFNKGSAVVFLDTIKRIRSLEEHSEEAINIDDGKKIVLEFFLKNNEEIYMRKNKIDIYISEEALEYAVYKLNEFLKNGYFSPAEFYAFEDRKKKKNKTIDVYFMETPSDVLHPNVQ